MTRNSRKTDMQNPCEGKKEWNKSTGGENFCQKTGHFFLYNIRGGRKQ